jgi:hypothetical protein
MKQRRHSTTRRTKSDPKKTDHEENTVVDTNRLLEEVKDINKRISDPSERERVIPSRPC